jgi:Spy/CpxP family protein refolding chaperone
MARLFERLPSLPWILFALSLTLNVFFLGGYYSKRLWDQRFAGGSEEQGRYIVEKLSFSPDQRQRFNDLRQRARERQRETMRANRQVIDGLWHEIELPEPNAAQIDGYIDHLTANRQGFQREQMRDLLAFAKTLEQKQRLEFLELVRARLERGPMIPRRPDMRPER